MRRIAIESTPRDRNGPVSPPGLRRLRRPTRPHRPAMREMPHQILQFDHWRLGHKQVCKKIHRGGNADKCDANKSYKEAVAVAVEKCADDTKEQTCYICTEAVHWKTKEGLVRMCACRGGSGFVHVSCLTEQAKILVEGAEDLATGTTRADCDAFNVSWGKWSHCGLCEQQFHGAVRCALGWAYWKTYLGRPAWDTIKYLAAQQLSGGLHEGGRLPEELACLKSILEVLSRQPFSAEQASHVVNAKMNMAGCYDAMGRHAEALALEQECERQRAVLNALAGKHCPCREIPRGRRCRPPPDKYPGERHLFG